ncbi:hypothetical protein H0H81_011982 [Sphagnurus paluster]|uniref:Uncharacterized protein n=1 Tax=Sphagnurus paluster TaxID=117069 RepID=A0A9P7KMA4_9AGAR|nr:hypothetical protein H0H81_011982 [Sphagnurus paluster]
MQQNMAIPGLSSSSLEGLSVADLENLARKSLRLHRNWTSLSPLPSNKLTIRPSSQHDRVFRTFEFLRVENRSYLLTFTIRRAPEPLFSLQCWDLNVSETPPTCVADRTVASYGLFAINRQRGSRGVVAIQLLDIELLQINFSAQDPASAFRTIAKIPETKHRLVALHGSLIVTQDEQENLHISDLSKPEAQLELHRRGKISQKTLEVVIQGELIIIVRLDGLEIFSISNLWSKEETTYPLVQHIWQWSLDSVSVAPQASWTPRKYAPINILLRFGSLLPWPVNLIHQFILHLNPSYDNTKPIASGNVPYEIVPTLRCQIGSPVRLFSNYHMAIGSRGTAVWIDNHTEDYFGHGECGQRLAGTLLATSDHQDMHEDYYEAESSMGSTVFEYCESDEWTRVAIDNNEGMIAVGHLDGTIVVREYT